MVKGTDKFYLSLLGWSLVMMHVIDAVLESFSNLFRSHRYPPLEKLYSVILFTAGLSLSDLSERLSLTGASRESVRIWVHRFSSLFRPSRRVRRLIAVDETVLKVNRQICYLWAAIDVDTNEILAVYASRGRGIPRAIEFLRKVLDSCEGKPVIRIERCSGDEGVNEDVEQQRKREDIEEHRMVSNCNCSNAQNHQNRRKGGNTNLTVPMGTDKLKLVLPLLFCPDNVVHCCNCSY
jgi:transposase-like protein